MKQITEFQGDYDDTGELTLLYLANACRVYIDDTTTAVSSVLENPEILKPYADCKALIDSPFVDDCRKNLAGDADGNDDCVACERFVRRERRKELRAALLRGVDMARKGCRRMGIEWVEREQLGNVAKLREVLEKSGKAAHEIQEATEEADTAEVAASIAEMCERALLFPPRNCDRGREAAEDAFTAEFGRPWTEEEARVAAWLFEEAGRTGTPRQDADGRAEG